MRTVTEDVAYLPQIYMAIRKQVGLGVKISNIDVIIDDNGTKRAAKLVALRIRTERKEE